MVCLPARVNAILRVEQTLTTVGSTGEGTAGLDRVVSMLVITEPVRVRCGTSNCKS
jgi:hypothetical protein